jgi:hypothetical protein
MRAVTPSLLAALLLLSGCMTPTGPVEVTRFNRVADGAAYGKGSFSIGSVTENGNANGISISPYRASVAREMARIGYIESAPSSAAIGSDVTANIEITVIDLGARASSSPVSVGIGGSTGGRRSGLGVGVGLDLTSLINKPQRRISTALSVRLIARAEGQSDARVIWEGKAIQEASAGTPAAQPGIAASKLAQGLFQDFPGISGETIIVR